MSERTKGFHLSQYKNTNATRIGTPGVPFSLNGKMCEWRINLYRSSLSEKIDTKSEPDFSPQFIPVEEKAAK